MAVISSQLLETIHELQRLSSLENSALGGGTNLAIRYGHRKSTDIDVFFPDIIGKEGFRQIEKEVCKFYGDELFSLQYPCDIDDQFIFLRFFVRKEDETIKVEIMQNMVMSESYDTFENIRMVSEKDIAMFKLMFVSNRASQKDIYDLDYLTDKFDLLELYQSLTQKQEKFSDPKYHNIFDQDGEVSPVNNPLLLLKFEDSKVHVNEKRPLHSQNRIDVAEGHKSWILPGLVGELRSGSYSGN